jgi:transcriptional regulator with XRE-family HTH domain
MKLNGTVKRPAYAGTLQRIGRKLTELRLQKGYKNRIDFAKDFGLPHIQYWRMEKGMANITIKSLDKVLSIHRLTVEDFFVMIKNDKGKAAVK